MRQLEDAIEHITDRVERAVALNSAINSEPALIMGHFGYVIEAKLCQHHPDCTRVTIRHTGVEGCGCRQLIPLRFDKHHDFY